jgi:hypothetical protein
MALVCKAPNLAKLELTMTDDWLDTNFLLKRNNKRFIGPKFTLKQLAELKINYFSHYSYCFSRMRSFKYASLNKLNGLLHSAPHLETLSLDYPRGGTKLTARLTNLKTLKITNAALCAKGLRKLTQTCHDLVHFEFTHDTLSDRIPPSPVSPAAALDCLAPAKDSLRNLRLSVALHPTHWKTVPEGEFKLLTRLAGFVELRHVVLDYRSIGKDLVGLFRGLDHLESVFLFGVDASDRVFEGVFQDFLQAVRRMEWPRLKAVKLQSLGEWHKHREVQVWKSLVRCLEKLGLAGGQGVVVAGVRVVALPGWVETGRFAEC